MQHSTYGALYKHIEKRVKAPYQCDGKFTHARVFAKVHHMNFFELKYKLELAGAKCDHEIIEVIKPKMPASSPISTKPRRGY